MSGALAYASEEIRYDREVVLEPFNSMSGALAYASEEIRYDREVVLAAVQQHEWALAYASEEIRYDREVVLAAVAGAAEELRNKAAGKMVVVVRLDAVN